MKVVPSARFIMLVLVGMIYMISFSKVDYVRAIKMFAEV